MATVRVRIAVAVDKAGDWNAAGWFFGRGADPEELMELAVDGVADGEAQYWLEADLEIPKDTETVQAEVTRVC